MAWQNSTLHQGDLAEPVAALKHGGDGELHVLGSTELVRTLIEHDLVDEFRLMIDPITVGGGETAPDSTLALSSLDCAVRR